MRKDGSGFCQIYPVEFGLIRVGSKKLSFGRMDLGWVRYIKLSKDISCLDWIYQAMEEWIKLGPIYQVEEGWIRVGSDISS